MNKNNLDLTESDIIGTHVLYRSVYRDYEEKEQYDVKVLYITDYSNFNITVDEIDVGYGGATVHNREAGSFRDVLLHRTHPQMFVEFRPFYKNAEVWITSMNPSDWL